MTNGLIGASLFAAVWFAVAFCWRSPSIMKSIVKTASVAGLALAAWVSGGPAMLVLALALGSLGDFFLSRNGQAAFLAGLSAFAAAHLAYVALLMAAGGGVVFGATSLVLICFGLCMGALLFAHAEALRWLVLGYVAIIMVMGLVAIGLPPVLRIVQIAALSFILSDAVLGLEVFVLPADHPLRRITPFVVWCFYWGAQFSFLIGFVPG